MTSCPVPFDGPSEILLGHGSGGRLTQQLIERLILPAFHNEWLEPLHDGAILPPVRGRLAFSADGHVVRPLFFPGGDIGRLAVHGTVNDLAMCGARPLHLSVGFILEEGLPLETLARVVGSMREAAEDAGVAIVCGDTKVVERGKGDGIFIQTSGVGEVRDGVRIDARRVIPGDRVLLSGPIAAHGIAILSVRDGLEFTPPIRSDTAPLSDIVRSLLDAVPDVRVMRDPTRGGVVAALTEIALRSGTEIRLWEESIPVDEVVRGACELLGLDPLHVASEGKFLAIVAPEEAGLALAVLRAHPMGSGAAVIGEVTGEDRGVLTLRTRMGGRRMLDLLSGDQLPRIC